jgi:hypothetical protein
VLGQDGACSIVPNEEGCAGVAFETESIPLDIYVLFDQSGSMCTCVDPPAEHSMCPDPNCNKTRLQATREALEIFMRDPASAGIGIGIGYFGYHPFGQTSCDGASYAKESVSIAELPLQAGAVLASLEGISPTGETPTGAAIDGACSYARAAALSRPGHKVVLLVLTDGKPEAPVTCPGGEGACCPTLLAAEQSAKTCNGGEVPIDVYVLGVGPLVGNLDGIALAGGTKQAYLVPEDGNVDGLVTALNAIRGDAVIPCDLKVTSSTGAALDYGMVNITYADGQCNGTTYGYVGQGGDCSDLGGWYLDSSAEPPVIRLCPVSCEQVSQAGGQLLVTVGCEREVAPVQ